MNESFLVYKAIEAINDNDISFCRFLTANDTGETGAHQAGIFIAKGGSSILFTSPGEKGENKSRIVRIKWQDDFSTDSRFIYYGQGTRDEYRITRFGKKFPYLKPEHTGDLFIISRLDDYQYVAFVLETENEINQFLDSFGMSPADTGRIIQKNNINQNTKIQLLINALLINFTDHFPLSKEMSIYAQAIDEKVNGVQNLFLTQPDKQLLNWIDVEFQLFRSIEDKIYGNFVKNGFSSVDKFIEKANEMLNRRKSRAGKSLEHHLSKLFSENSLLFVEQASIEGNKKPDFLFPNDLSYKDKDFPSDKLIFLGAKTTCKDRWRQILNEASRIKTKHLCTLQQGISPSQLREMYEANVILVVPEQYRNSYPIDFRKDIWSIAKFIGFVKEKQNL